VSACAASMDDLNSTLSSGVHQVVCVVETYRGSQLRQHDVVQVQLDLWVDGKVKGYVQQQCMLRRPNMSFDAMLLSVERQEDWGVRYHVGHDGDRLCRVHGAVWCLVLQCCHLESCSDLCCGWDCQSGRHLGQHAPCRAALHGCCCKVPDAVGSRKRIWSCLNVVNTNCVERGRLIWLHGCRCNACCWIPTPLTKWALRFTRSMPN
jgi:hypothetical protein